MKAHEIPIGKIGPGRHQKRKGRPGNAYGIENFGSEIIASERIYHADENVYAAKMKGKKFPLPLTGCRGTDVFPEFVRNKKCGHYVKEFLSCFFIKLFVIKHCGDHDSDKKRRYEKMDGAEMFETKIIGFKLIHGAFGVPEKRHKNFPSFSGNVF